MSKQFIGAMAFLALLGLIVADIYFSETQLATLFRTILLFTVSVAVLAYTVGLVSFFWYWKRDIQRARFSVYTLYTALVVIVVTGLIHTIDIISFIIDVTFFTSMNPTYGSRNVVLDPNFFDLISTYAKVITYGTLASMSTLIVSMIVIAQRAAVIVGIIQAEQYSNSQQNKRIFVPVISMLCSAAWGLYVLLFAGL